VPKSAAAANAILGLIKKTFLHKNLQCFDIAGWASGRACSLLQNEWCGAAVVIRLEWGANNLHMVQLMPLPPRYLSLH